MAGVYARRYHYWDAEEPVRCPVGCLSSLSDFSKLLLISEALRVLLSRLVRISETGSTVFPLAVVILLQREGAHSYELTFYTYALLELSQEHNVR